MRIKQQLPAPQIAAVLFVGVIVWLFVEVVPKVGACTPDSTEASICKEKSI